MANSQPPYLVTVIDLEKGEDGRDSSSIRSFNSSAQQTKDKDTDHQPISAASPKDLKASPNEMQETGVVDTAMSRTSTRGSWRNVVKVVTKTSTKSSWKDPGPPPDGGLLAWTQVAIGHLVIMNTWGFINSFGVFQTYYVESLSRPPSDIAWVGSIQVFLLFFVSTWTGRLTDAGYFRQLVILGTILQTLGLFMASLSTQYWQLFLAQGICLGLGNGCFFCPMISLVSTYFSAKRSLAIGIVACGSATGGLIFPAMVQQLLPKVGFGWTIRAIGLVQLACLITCIAFAKQRLLPRRAGPIVEWAAFTELPYSLFAAGIFFIFWGIYFAFYYVGSYARNVIGVSYNESINLILVLNGVGIVGRIVPCYFADIYTGPLNMIIPVSAISAIAVYCWIPVSARGGLYAWAVMYGLFGSAIQGLFPAVLASLTTELKKRGVRMGMIFSIVSFAVLTGPPIEGALIQKGNGNYLYAQLFAATLILIGTILMVGCRISTTGLVTKVMI